MAHIIDERCIGCTACVNVCPTDAITGARKLQHVIDEDLCIDCSACARICPVECIMDHEGNYPPRVAKRHEWPKPVVDEVLCTGCNWCVDVCPFDCLDLVSAEDHETPAAAFLGIAKLTKPNACVACYMCEEVCAKAAIVVRPVQQLQAQAS